MGAYRQQQEPHDSTVVILMIVLALMEQSPFNTASCHAQASVPLESQGLPCPGLCTLRESRLQVL
eukprot:1154852-Pelagomonas_calceolata.AAC.5